MSSADVVVVRSPVFDGLPVVHGFTQRHGGIAPAPRDSLTVAAHPALPTELLGENVRRAVHAVDALLDPERVVFASQVHGEVVLEVSEPTGWTATAGEADGLVTSTEGLVLAVRVADCVPVLLAGAGGVAAVHAGWRGVAAGIVPKGVAAVGKLGGPVRAVLGPHIHQDAFEVGPEVVEALALPGLPREAYARPGVGDRWHVDLAAVLRHQLLAAGVRPADLDVIGGCTTGPDWFSYRADGPDTGRQAGWIAWVG